MSIDNYSFGIVFFCSPQSFHALLSVVWPHLPNSYSHDVFIQSITRSFPNSLICAIFILPIRAVVVTSESTALHGSIPTPQNHTNQHQLHFFSSFSLPFGRPSLWVPRFRGVRQGAQGPLHPDSQRWGRRYSTDSQTGSSHQQDGALKLATNTRFVTALPRRIRRRTGNQWKSPPQLPPLLFRKRPLS